MIELLIHVFNLNNTIGSLFIAQQSTKGSTQRLFIVQIKRERQHQTACLYNFRQYWKQKK